MPRSRIRRPRAPGAGMCSTACPWTGNLHQDAFLCAAGGVPAGAGLSRAEVRPRGVTAGTRRRRAGRVRRRCRRSGGRRSARSHDEPARCAPGARRQRRAPHGAERRRRHQLPTRRDNLRSQAGSLGFRPRLRAPRQAEAPTSQLDSPISFLLSAVAGDIIGPGRSVSSRAALSVLTAAAQDARLFRMRSRWDRSAWSPRRAHPPAPLCARTARPGR